MGLASSNLALLAMLALMDVPLALGQTFVLSVNLESLLTMDSAMSTALLGQLPALILLLVLLATHPVLPVLNIQVNAPVVTHAVVLSLTSNVYQAAQWDHIRSTVLANTAHTTVLLVLEVTLPVLHAQQQRFSSMELVMINVLLS